MDPKPTGAKAASSKAPPLPPRQISSNAPSYFDAPPSYDSITPPEVAPEWTAQDLRSSSTQSLVPTEANAQNDRRRLLMIYIHGFMGDPTSFRSFPAHVHNLLTVLLVETHVVHTKIYPRYRSKRNISFARDDFSNWLAPHEAEKTDVVLLGHSMGGLLSAEVALMPPPGIANRPLNHRILGTINFDVPFLGMHPGVVKSGLASIFKGADETPGDRWSPQTNPALTDDGASSITGPMSPLSIGGRLDTLWQPGQADPNFNPSFQNDVVLPMRKGWANALHFVNKHKDHLYKETKKLVTSHLEFGGAMANYSELKTRYSRLRALEEEDMDVRKSVTKISGTPPRVRFVNYYTASTGRPKKVQSPQHTLSPSTTNRSQTSLSPSMIEETGRGRTQGNGAVDPQTSRSHSPRISLEEHSDDRITKKDIEMPSSEDEDWQQAAETLTIGHPGKENAQPAVESTSLYSDETLSPTASLSTLASLPPIPDLPSAPPPLDVAYIQDADTRKLVEKEHARAVKSYQKAMKDRDKAIKDRARLDNKRERKTREQAEKAIKDAEKAKVKAEKDVQKAKQNAAASPEPTHSQREHSRLEQERERMEAEGRRMRGEASPASSEEKITTPVDEDEEKTTEPIDESEIISPDEAPALQQLPSPSHSPASRSQPSPSPSPPPESKAKSQKPQKDHKFCTLPPKDKNGQRDPLWVRVFMENVDEVGAHCGLFFVDERYERLVGEVAERIEGWVRDDGDVRTIRGFGDYGEEVD